MEIPAEIIEKIEGMAIKESSSPSDYEYLKKYYRFGYSLASNELKEKDKEIARLKALIERMKDQVALQLFQQEAGSAQEIYDERTLKATLQMLNSTYKTE